MLTLKSRTYIHFYRCHDHIFVINHKHTNYEYTSQACTRVQMPLKLCVNEEHSRQRLWQVQFVSCVLRSTLFFFFCLKSVSSSQKVSSACLRGIHPWHLEGCFPSRYSSSVPSTPPQKKTKVPRATDRNSKHPYIGPSHLLTSLAISSVSPFVYNSPRAHSHPPSLCPCSAPIGSQSCSTGRLLAPSHRNLAEAARICPHTNRSLAFCLWTDGTEK